MIEIKKLEIKKAGHSKARCDKCHKLVRIRNLVDFKGRYLCTNCKENKIWIYHGHPVSLIDALNKVYEAKGYLRMINNKPAIRAVLSVPSILIGHKIKFVLVDNV